jgi:formamidopyrimidine-DNA glycosylase
MPELPEVQTVINYLNDKISGQKIINVEILAHKMLKNASVEDFKSILSNSTIINVKRVGKYLIFHLDNGYVMVSHLRMEGKYFVKDKSDIITDKHIHIIFELTDMNLCYHDTRKFGTFTIYKANDFMLSTELIKIGIDPLSPIFNPQYLFDKIEKSKKAIKTLLLDQAIVSGIGNIYACEILFSAKVSPFRLGSEITFQECELIAKESTRILNLAIENKGTTVSSFSFDNNHSGTFQKYLNVYGRTNKKCHQCDNPIIKDYINKRGTYYCSHCQG